MRSVERQTVTNWECLIVDDGSTDDTAHIGFEFAQRDSRFTVVKTTHSGLVDTLQEALSLAKGDILIRMDADDCMHPLRLSHQLSALRNNADLAGVGCHVRLFPRRELTDGRRAYESWLNSLASPENIARDRFIECPLAHPTWAVRASWLQSLGYRDVSWPEDYDFLLRAFARGARFGVVPTPLLAWRDHAARLSRNDGMYSLEAFTHCRAHYLATDFLKDAKQYTLWGHGPTGRNLRRALGDENKTAHTVVEVNPRKVGQVIRGAPVISPERLDKTHHAPLISAVSGPRPRALIRERLVRLGWTEGLDFVCAA